MDSAAPATAARSLLGNRIKDGASPEAVADARRQLAAANIQRAIDRALATAPPLTDAQCDLLAARLRAVEVAP